LLPTNKKEHARGFYVHPLIAVTPERLHLGVVDLQHHRHDEPGKYDKKRDSLPIEEKSSVRWLNGYRKGNEIAKKLKDTQVIVIGDRESDIYELFSEAQQFPDGGADWIVRGSHNRRLVGEEAYSIDSLEASTPKGVISFSYNGSQKREARDVYLTIYSQTLSPRAPRRTGQKLPQAAINCILATEENPPAGEEPIRWYLLTSLPVDEPEQIKTVMHYYLCRWEIEVFFRMLKSGCEIEELQLEALSRLLPCIALYMIVSWHILYVMMLGRTVPELPCNVVFEDIEWHAAYVIAHKRKPPETPPSLAELILIIAQFGGYLARKNDPPPGPKAMWVGMQKLRNYTVGFQAHAAITTSS
jgi:IS4 transposase